MSHLSRHRGLSLIWRTLFSNRKQNPFFILAKNTISFSPSDVCLTFWLWFPPFPWCLSTIALGSVSSALLETTFSSQHEHHRIVNQVWSPHLLDQQPPLRTSPGERWSWQEAMACTPPAACHDSAYAVSTLHQGELTKMRTASNDLALCLFPHQAGISGASPHTARSGVSLLLLLVLSPNQYCRWYQAQLSGHLSL